MFFFFFFHLHMLPFKLFSILLLGPENGNLKKKDLKVQISVNKIHRIDLWIVAKWLNWWYNTYSWYLTHVLGATKSKYLFKKVCNFRCISWKSKHLHTCLVLLYEVTLIINLVIILFWSDQFSLLCSGYFLSGSLSNIIIIWNYTVMNCI